MFRIFVGISARVLCRSVCVAILAMGSLTLAARTAHAVTISDDDTTITRADASTTSTPTMTEILGSMLPNTRYDLIASGLSDGTYTFNLYLGSDGLYYVHYTSGTNNLRFRQVTDVDSQMGTGANVAENNRATAFGDGASATGVNSSAFGAFASATGDNSAAFGFASAATESTTSAFGSQAQASGMHSSAFGAQAQATGVNSSAFGQGAQATGMRSTAIGANAVADENNQVVLGTSTNIYRLPGLTGSDTAPYFVSVDADGDLASTALSAAWPLSVGTLETEPADLTSAYTQVASDLTDGTDTFTLYRHDTENTLHVVFTTGANLDMFANIAPASRSGGGGVVSDDSMDDANRGKTAFGNGAFAIANRASAFGAFAQATADFSTAIGVGAIAGGAGAGAVALGYDARTNGDSAAAIGRDARANGAGATALGWNARATGDNSVAIGRAALSNQPNLMVLGTFVGRNGATATTIYKLPGLRGAAGRLVTLAADGTLIAAAPSTAFDFNTPFREALNLDTGSALFEVSVAREVMQATNFGTAATGTVRLGGVNTPEVTIGGTGTLTIEIGTAAETTSANAITLGRDDATSPTTYILPGLRNTNRPGDAHVVTTNGNGRLGRTSYATLFSSDGASAFSTALRSVNNFGTSVMGTGVPGTVYLGGVNTQTINIGGTGTTGINIGTGGTAAQTIALGGTATTYTLPGLTGDIAGTGGVVTIDTPTGRLRRTSYATLFSSAGASAFSTALGSVNNFGTSATGTVALGTGTPTMVRVGDIGTGAISIGALSGTSAGEQTITLGRDDPDGVGEGTATTYTLPGLGGSGNRLVIAGGGGILGTTAYSALFDNSGFTDGFDARLQGATEFGTAATTEVTLGGAMTPTVTIGGTGTTAINIGTFETGSPQTIKLGHSGSGTDRTRYELPGLTNDIAGTHLVTVTYAGSDAGVLGRTSYTTLFDDEAFNTAFTRQVVLATNFGTTSTGAVTLGHLGTGTINIGAGTGTNTGGQTIILGRVAPSGGTATTYQLPGLTNVDDGTDTHFVTIDRSGNLAVSSLDDVMNTNVQEVNLATATAFGTALTGAGSTVSLGGVNTQTINIGTLGAPEAGTQTIILGRAGGTPTTYILPGLNPAASGETRLVTVAPGGQLAATQTFETAFSTALEDERAAGIGVDANDIDIIELAGFTPTSGLSSEAAAEERQNAEVAAIEATGRYTEIGEGFADKEGDTFTLYQRGNSYYAQYDSTTANVDKQNDLRLVLEDPFGNRAGGGGRTGSRAADLSAPTGTHTTPLAAVTSETDDTTLEDYTWVTEADEDGVRFLRADDDSTLFRVTLVAGEVMQIGSAVVLATAYGESAQALGTHSTAFGAGAVASNTGSSAFGAGASATGGFSVAIGLDAAASGSGAIAIGLDAMALDDDSTALGNGAEGGGFSSTALGSFASAGGESSTALGDFSAAGGDFSTAIGSGASARGESSTAIGAGATATVANQIVLGTSAESYRLPGLFDTSPSRTGRQVVSVTADGTLEVSDFSDAGIEVVTADIDIENDLTGYTRIGEGFADKEGDIFTLYLFNNSYYAQYADDPTLGDKQDDLRLVLEDPIGNRAGGGARAGTGPATTTLTPLDATDDATLLTTLMPVLTTTADASLPAGYTWVTETDDDGARLLRADGDGTLFSVTDRTTLITITIPDPEGGFVRRSSGRGFRPFNAETDAGVDRFRIVDGTPVGEFQRVEITPGVVILATAYGERAEALETRSSAFGAFASATGERSTAIGAGASAPHAGSTAIGAGAATNADNQIVLGFRTGGEVGSFTTYRLPGLPETATMDGTHENFVTIDGSGNLAVSSLTEVMNTAVDLTTTTAFGTEVTGELTTNTVFLGGIETGAINIGTEDAGAGDAAVAQTITLGHNGGGDSTLATRYILPGFSDSARGGLSLVSVTTDGTLQVRDFATALTTATNFGTGTAAGDTVALGGTDTGTVTIGGTNTDTIGIGTSAAVATGTQNINIGTDATGTGTGRQNINIGTGVAAGLTQAISLGDGSTDTINIGGAGTAINIGGAGTTYRLSGLVGGDTANTTTLSFVSVNATGELAVQNFLTTLATTVEAVDAIVLGHADTDDIGPIMATSYRLPGIQAASGTTEIVKIGDDGTLSSEPLTTLFSVDPSSDFETAVRREVMEARDFGTAAGTEDITLGGPTTPTINIGTGATVAQEINLGTGATGTGTQNINIGTGTGAGGQTIILGRVAGTGTATTYQLPGLTDASNTDSATTGNRYVVTTDGTGQSQLAKTAYADLFDHDEFNDAFTRQVRLAAELGTNAAVASITLGGADTTAINIGATTTTAAQTITLGNAGVSGSIDPTTYILPGLTVDAAVGTDDLFVTTDASGNLGTRSFSFALTTETAFGTTVNTEVRLGGNATPTIALGGAGTAYLLPGIQTASGEGTGIVKINEDGELSSAPLTELFSEGVGSDFQTAVQRELTEAPSFGTHTSVTSITLGGTGTTAINIGTATTTAAQTITLGNAGDAGIDPTTYILSGLVGGDPTTALHLVSVDMNGTLGVQDFATALNAANSFGANAATVALGGMATTSITLGGATTTYTLQGLTSDESATAQATDDAISLVTTDEAGNLSTKSLATLFGSDASRAIGGAVASGTNAIAFGMGARATSSGAIALGQNARATSSSAIALGQDARATAVYATALGKGARAIYARSTALGAGALTSRENQIVIGTVAVAGTDAFTTTYTLRGLKTSESSDAQAVTDDGVFLVTTDSEGNLATTSLTSVGLGTPGARAPAAARDRDNGGNGGGGGGPAFSRVLQDGFDDALQSALSDTARDSMFNEAFTREFTREFNGNFDQAFERAFEPEKAGLEEGIALAAALSGLQHVDGARVSLSAGLGTYGGEAGLAMQMAFRPDNNVILSGGLGLGLGGEGEVISQISFSYGF